MEFVKEEGTKSDAECSSLIVPAISIGNVGQLAVDLMISTTKAHKIGYLDDPSLLPCVGNDAFGPLPLGDLALPLEVYNLASDGLTFVQQRSPVIKGMMVQFAKNLADFAVAAGKKHVILLSSLDFQRWQKVDMSSGIQIHYVSSSNADGTDDDCEKLGWKKLEEYKPSQRRWAYLQTIAEGSSLEEDAPSEEIDEDEDYFASLPFAALFSCFKARGLKVTCLLCYCSEGDNIADSINLAEAACKVLGLKRNNLQSGDGEWSIPLSWKSVYGPPPDMSMF
ncbi:hypothetical protein RND81_03G141900 [Saponaria officinalis]|uniref:Proteasome assembly chaperone 2 n=1 Tax=Saponaria officinalis TaxID=3572 RepID=A0AAW1M0E5_SAPOF